MDWEQFQYIDDEFDDMPQRLGRVYHAVDDFNGEQVSTGRASSFLHIRLDSMEGDCLQSQFLFRTMHCEVKVNGEMLSSKFSISSLDGKHYKTAREDRIDLVWELFDYYGPTQVEFRIVEKGLFNSVSRALGSVSLGALGSSEKAYFALGQQNSAGNINTNSPPNIPWGVPCAINLIKLTYIHPLSYAKYSQPSPRPVIDSKYSKLPLSENRKQGTISVSDSKAISLNKSSQVVPVRVKFHFRIVDSRDCYRPSALLATRLLDGQGISELHYAVENNAGDLVKSLLRNLSRRSLLRHALSVRNSKHQNPLEIALAQGNASMTRLLLTRAGIWCFQNTFQMTPTAIHHALQGGSCKCLVLLLRFLRRNAADIIGWTNVFNEMLEWKDGMAMTPLSAACSIQKCPPEAITELLSIGAHPRGLNTVTQRTAFMYACESGRTDCALRLLALEKSIAELRSDGIDPRRLQNSRGGGLQNAILLKKKCCPGDRDISGITAIMLAAGGGHLEIVELLLSLGIDTSNTTDAGECIFHFAARGGNRQLCQILADRESAQWNSYRADVKERSLLKTMQHRPMMLCFRNHRGFQPHHVAKASGHHEVADYLTTTARRIYREKKMETSFDPLDIENVEEYFGDRMDEKDYEFAMAPLSQGPNNYYATAAMISATEKDRESAVATGTVPAVIDGQSDGKHVLKLTSDIESSAIPERGVLLPVFIGEAKED